ncbi:hypothetical protein niasHT_020820 [Heterodera trifolii]|uniref:DNA-directed DNA polymerase n=1 Tax=Heterodera trifolii TaxID=157864 RepID=A0ABD2JMV4_9BILA
MTVTFNTEFRLIECVPMLEEVAREFGCITPLPNLGSHRDYRVSGCMMIRTLTSLNRLYIFDAEDCIEGFLRQEDGTSQKVVNEYYEKYDGLNGFTDYKLIPIKLASFVKTFGLQIDGVDNKKYFPHKFNKAANYGVVLDSLPPLDDYYPGGHFPEERKKLEQWYEENRNTPFDLREVIADYCKADVQILAHGMVKMRQLFAAATSQELTDSITIPSACMKFFVLLSHVGKERVAIIPHLGYEKRGKQSAIARKYLKWRAEEEMRENGWTLRHVESPGGEYKHGNFLLDGMLERIGEDKNLAIEVNGCYWHACPHCFPEDDAIVGGGETASAIRARDAKRI